MALVVSLSPRQGQVLSGKELGLSNKEIADGIGISVSSVKTHLKKIFEKTGARSGAAAVYVWRHRALPVRPDFEAGAQPKALRGKQGLHPQFGTAAELQVRAGNHTPGDHPKGQSARWAA